MIIENAVAIPLGGGEIREVYPVQSQPVRARISILSPMQAEVAVA
jgi:hypothetical protein